MAMRKINALSFAIMMRTLIIKPRSLYDIVEETGLGYETVRTYVRELHRQRVVCIAGWRECTEKNGVQALYAVNNGLQARDAAKPPPMTNAEKSRRHYQKMKARREALAKVSDGRHSSNDSRTGGNNEAGKHA